MAGRFFEESSPEAVLSFFANIPSCLVGLEACGGGIVTFAEYRHFLGNFCPTA
jgi:transposase